MHMTFVGIGSGNPDHLTGQAIRAIRDADIVLIPVKPDEKQELASLREAICDMYLSGADIRRFAMPERDSTISDYRVRVEHWHDAIATLWNDTIGPRDTGRVVMLVWGDPSLFDSTLRIAQRLQAMRPVTIDVVAGITSLQLLTAAHAIPLNSVAEPILITTGRQLRDNGWPDGVDTLAVMLDGACAFQTLDTTGVEIWWGAYLGMQGEILRAGALVDVAHDIITTRAAARAERGWVMDIYLLRRTAP